jgi:shikimate kinase/3-dehydroquinate synthase
MRHLLLNGFMATGKSTVGPLVSADLGLPFFDVDDEVERRSGNTVAEIFDKVDEAHFRSLESDTLIELLRGEPKVLALGGGALQDERNRRAVEAGGLVVTLSCSVPELGRRMQAGGPVVRPLLRAVSDQGTQGLAGIEALLRQRSWIYDAYPTVNTEAKPPTAAAAEIVATYRKYGSGANTGAYEVRFPGGTRTRVIFGQEIMAAGDDHFLEMLSVAPSQLALVWDQTVAGIFSGLAAKIASADVNCLNVVIEPGEAAKNLETVSHMYSVFQQARLDRDAVVVAVGGGVIADAAGFAAATYLRGLRLVTVPTTLLAQVDAAVGGKTGVDLDGGKNLVGSFYPAELVAVDTKSLRTLPSSRLREGLAEMIKIAAVRDAGLFHELQELSSAEEIVEREDLIRRAVRNKVEVVNADPYERTGERALLNFGHTIGHAIEHVSGYSVPHGECVAIGMVAEAYIAAQMGLTDAATLDQLRGCLLKHGLPVEVPGYAPEALLDAMRHDKKRAGGSIRMVMLKTIGEAELRPVSEDSVMSVFGCERART